MFDSRQAPARPGAPGTVPGARPRGLRPGRTLRRWLVALAAAAVACVAIGVIALAAPGSTLVSGVTFPFNGVWLSSSDAAGGHYWDASGAGLCRIDGATEVVTTCDVQAKKPTQVAVGPKNADGTYYLYSADMSSKSGGPLRLTYDPAGDGGHGAIVANSAATLGGLNTVGFFADAAGNFKVSSVALGPCDHSSGSVIDAATPCLALYLAFERSQMIERINNVDRAPAAQTIETISKVTDKRKGVRFGIGVFHNGDGTDDLYIDELGGNGVSMLADVAKCAPSLGTADPTITNPPVNQLGGCAAAVVPGITTNFPQGMAVLNDPLPAGTPAPTAWPLTGPSRAIYVADSPRNAPATVLRYFPATKFQDVVSSSVASYPSLLNPGQNVTTYTFVLGLALNPNNGDLFIGDDPTFAILVNPPTGMGHIFTIGGVAANNRLVPADCAGSATTACTPPAPPSTVTPSLYAYGLTAPKGGAVFVPSADGGHVWAADHSQGLCRMDIVTSAPGLHAYNAAACDDGSVLGSGGQVVYDDTPVGANGFHYLYVAQNDHLSPGVLRFTFDPNGDGGAGALVDNGVVMAPNGGIGGDKANGLALGPCVPDPVTPTKPKFAGCTHALYVGGLLDGFIRRINNPLDAPSLQSVDVVAMTTEQRTGTPGRGINGSMGMIGDDLYLPENQGFTAVKNITSCPTVVQGTSQVCGTVPLNIGQFGFIFAAGLGVDADPAHSAAGLVYASISPGAANATVYQYDVATNTARIYATQGRMPAAGTAEATVWCTTTCTRPVDPANPPGGLANFRFAQGVTTAPDGSVLLAEDAFAGARGGRGHLWVAPFIPYPAGVTPVPLPIPSAPAPAQTCKVTLNVPPLASGQTYWVQFTTHAAGQISSTWSIPAPQSAKLLLYPGNPFAGLADPVSKGSVGGALAQQNTSNTTSFAISTAPNAQPAGTYTAQLFNGSNSFAATTATITFTNDTATACPASPTSAHVLS